MDMEVATLMEHVFVILYFLTPLQIAMRALMTILSFLSATVNDLFYKSGI